MQWGKHQYPPALSFRSHSHRGGSTYKHQEGSDSWNIDHPRGRIEILERESSHEKTAECNSSYSNWQSTQNLWTALIVSEPSSEEGRLPTSSALNYIVRYPSLVGDSRPRLRLYKCVVGHGHINLHHLETPYRYTTLPWKTSIQMGHLPLAATLWFELRRGHYPKAYYRCLQPALL